MKCALRNLYAIFKQNEYQKPIQRAKKYDLILRSHNLDQYINFCGSLLSTNDKYSGKNWAKPMTALLYIVTFLSEFPRTDFYEISVMISL